MKKIVLLFLLLCSGSFIFSQVSSDPSNEFYSCVEKWETLGIIEIQPSLRPYPLSLVEDILNKVISSDSEQENEIAKQIYQKTFNRPWNVMVNAHVNGQQQENDFLMNMRAKYGVEGDIKLFDNCSAGYQLDFLTAVKPDYELLPLYRATPYYMADGYGKIKNYLEIDGNFAAGFGDFVFQTGINHNSFGPFYSDSLVLSDNAKHTASFSLSYYGNNWAFTEAMFILNATNAVNFENKLPNKWLMLHSVDVNLTDWLSGSFYETVIYGNRFDPSYLIPMFYMVTQGVTGYADDNLFMGGTLVFRPMKGLEWDMDLYLDDIGFTSLKTYKDMRIRCAGATGIKYIPKNLSAVKMLKLNYTMMSPYMYSHVQYDDVSYGHPAAMTKPNYQIYTTSGYALGTSLEPNSDRVSLSAELKPVEGLNINIGGTLIRHANVSEGLTDKEKLSYLASAPDYFSTDGSITQHPIYLENGDTSVYGYMPSAWNKMMFLTQDTIEYTVQADLDVSYDFPETKYGKFGIGLGYTFEYIHNYGVGNQMFPGQGWFYNSSDEKFYKDASFTNEVDTAAELDAAYNNWKSSLKDLMHHYLRLNFSYSF